MRVVLEMFEAKREPDRAPREGSAGQEQIRSTFDVLGDDVADDADDDKVPDDDGEVQVGEREVREHEAGADFG